MYSIFSKLTGKIPDKYLNPLQEEFNKFQKAYLEDDEASLGIISGHICELISGFLVEHEHNIQIDLNQIKFDANYQKLTNGSHQTPNQELIGLMIPYVLRSVYTIRNKKRVAHFKTNLPKKIDMKYIYFAINWVISQLLILFLDSNYDDETINYLEQVSLDDFKKVERFEDGSMIFFEKLSGVEKIVFILMDYYNQGRVNKEELMKKVTDQEYFSTNLKRLKDRQLIHIDNDGGIILTKVGIEKAREIKLKLH